MKLFREAPILLVLIAGAGGLSCADIAAPSRGEAYEWRRIVSTDTLSFHWPHSRLPVKVWTEDSLDLPRHVLNGLNQWRAAFLYGEFDAVNVSDSNAADIIVRVGNPATAFSITRLESAMAPECEGGTDIIPPPGSQEIQFPVRVLVNPRFDPALPSTTECMGLTTTHELGHAIGIFAHSPDPADIMYGDPVVSALSPRDRSTAEVAYHTEPSLSVAPR